MSQTLLTNEKQGNLDKNTPVTLVSQRKLVLTQKLHFFVLKSLEHLQKFKNWPHPLFSRVQRL
jgi:hypothetical protein